MDYPLLAKLYYKDKGLYKQEYIARKSSIASIALPINIHSNPAFYINSPALIKLICLIYEQLNKLKKLYVNLPRVAYHSYVRSCLIDEIMLTNDIEGVYSTRKEINNILNTPVKNEAAKKRLQGLVLKYSKLYSDDEMHIELNNSKDIRALYDDIVISEISDNDKPDGAIFRKEVVSIISATEKEKHQGMPPPESNIIAAIDKALTIISDDEIPNIIGIALLHYYFGYIHPFYDGNGRLSRFISSYLLKKNFDLLVALRLSYAIKNNKNKYYKAFDIVNDEKNAGDVTPFIIMFLEMILAAENSLLSKLEQGIEKLSYFSELNKKVEKLNIIDNTGLNIIFVLIQNQLFGSEPFDIKTLAKEVGVSEITLRRRIDELLAISIPIKKEKSGRKYFYYIDLSAFENYCEMQE